MRRRNYFLPDELVAKAEKLAEKRSISVAEVVRTALEKYLAAVERAEAAKNGD